MLAKRIIPCLDVTLDERGREWLREWSSST